MLRWFFIVPYCTISIVTLVVFIIIYVGDRKNLFEKCINISNALFYPITFFGALILVILPFTHMQLIKLKFKSKWNLKTEMLVNSALLGAGNLEEFIIIVMLDSNNFLDYFILLLLKIYIFYYISFIYYIQ